MGVEGLSWSRLAVLVLPALAVGLGLGAPAALGLSLALLVVDWLRTLAATLRPWRGPTLRLETISVSHYVEKVRWCLDRLGEPYEEVPVVGILGVFLTGRTVPRLYVRAGRGWSVLGNSPEILRFLWGRYGHLGERAAFLEPTPEALELEQQLDDYGRDLQVWVYAHMLDFPELTLRAWGAEDPRLPRWQRWVVRGLFPLLRVFLRRAFRLGPTSQGWVRGRVEATLEGMEARLAEGRSFLAGGEALGFADITLASLSGLWIDCPEYGGGEAEFCRLGTEDLPATMAADVERWRGLFPRVVAHVEALFREQRRG